MTIFDGTNVINMPLEVTYDGEGTPHHRLLFPYPVDVSIAYTSVTVRYFLNPFVAANGNPNTDSSITLRILGLGSILTMPMSDQDFTSLRLAAADSSTIQAHFVQRDGDVVVYDVSTLEEVSGPGENVANLAYAGYTRANLTLMNYSFSTSNTAPADTGSVVLTINGTTFGGVQSVTAGTGLAVGTDASGIITETGTLNLTDTGVSAARYNRADVTVDAQGRITAAEAGIGDVNFNTQGTNAIRFVNDRFEFVIGNVTIAVLDANGMRAVDFINDPTPAN